MTRRLFTENAAIENMAAVVGELVSAQRSDTPAQAVQLKRAAKDCVVRTVTVTVWVLTLAGDRDVCCTAGNPQQLRWMVLR